MKILRDKRHNHQIDEVFYFQLLRSEKLRVQILLALLGLMLIALLLLFAVFREEYIYLFSDKSSLRWIIFSIVFFILYEFVVLNVINFFIRTNKTFPNFGRYGNSFFEVSFPTITMIVLSISSDPYLVLNGPASYAYFIFIILSTLRLDFRISFFTGLIAAAEYTVMSYYYLHFTTEYVSLSLFPGDIHYFSKGLLIFLSGIAAGFVSVEVRKRIISALTVIEERNQIINVFGQQVSPEIAEQLISSQSEESGTLKDVCIMFLDIRNFTSTVEKRDPKEIVAYQNKVFGLMIDIIHKQKGIINQFLGDGFMATFGAPVSRGNECASAVNAALEILKGVEKANEDDLAIPTKVGIGIHYGEAVTGNIGSDLRKQYSITGNVVILASRIEQLNKEFNTQLLISSEVFNNIDVLGEYFTSLGPVKVKGREEPIKIYTLK